MKAKLILTALFTFYFLLFPCEAQVPQGFNYQAIARDGLGNAITGATIEVKIGILSDTILNTMVWEELFNPVRTNAFGMFTIVVGTGVYQSGSATTFSDIDWTKTPLFLRTSIIYPIPSAWKVMGTSKLQSVPYSMVAGNLEGTVPLLSVKGNTATMDSALFVVRNNTGQIVFAVYNEGVRIYVDDGIAGKGRKGGFAIGSFNKSKGTQDYFVVTGDSIRAYIDTGLVKTRKGGFAIGSFNKSKTGGEEYFRVTRDSTRVYIDDAATKAAKGGFAIGSFNKSKAFFPQYMSVLPTRTNIQVKDTIKGFSITNIQGGGSIDFMRIDKINAFIGHETGLVTAPSTSGEQGKYNVFIGYQSGNKNTLGYKNVFLGYHAGMYNLTAEHNIFIGTESGISNISGRYNTFLGSESGALNTGSENTFLGYSAGVLNTSGQYNLFVGTNSGAFHSSGDYNTYLGWGSGNNNSGAKNVFIGASAGSSNSGSGNVFIGYAANVSGSNKLMVTNSSNTPNVPLIYGEFNNKMIAINKSTVTTGYTFWVEGAAGGLYNWNTTSDIRLKTNVTTITGALEKVLNMRGVNFEWKDQGSLEKGRRIGFIAQEVVKIVPEVVSTAGEFFTMQYAPVTALLVEALKDQQKLILDQRKRIDDLETIVRQLRSELNNLASEVNQTKSHSNNKN